MPEPTSPILDDPEVIAALGDGPELDQSNITALEILLDPANDPSEVTETRSEAIEEFSSFTGSDVDEPAQVADRLREHLNRQAGTYDSFEFELVRGCDGIVEQYNVLTRFGELTWLTISEDAKYLFGARHDLTGLRAAIYTAESIMADYNLLSTQAARLSPDTQRETFTSALNQAAEDVLAVAGREDQRLVDAVNLVVNAALHYTENPGADLDTAIRASYPDADADTDGDRDIVQTVRGWLTD